MDHFATIALLDEGELSEAQALLDAQFFGEVDAYDAWSFLVGALAGIHLVFQVSETPLFAHDPVAPSGSFLVKGNFGELRAA